MATMMRKPASFGLAMALAALAACAPRPVPTPPPQAPIAMPAVPLGTRPEPPSGAAPTLSIPRPGADGRYATINQGIGTDETVWNLRAALNVAALGCRTGLEQTIVTNYNTMLTRQKATLAAADTAIKAQYRKEAGSRWQDTHDDAMTKLYNYFAQPPVQRAFCRIATQVEQEAVTITPAEFPTFAATALARLEEPFQTFYKAYDQYRADLSAWNTRYAALYGQPAPQTTASTDAMVQQVSGAATAPATTGAMVQQVPEPRLLPQQQRVRWSSRFREAAAPGRPRPDPLRRASPARLRGMARHPEKGRESGTKGRASALTSPLSRTT